MRRSGRATKGQHTKNSEEPDATTKKRAGRGGRSKAAKKAETEATPEEEEDAIIRCICGYVEEDKNDQRAMICCDKCLAWQHNTCMGLSDDDDDLPEKYYCEQCKPEEHKELLEAMARGEKPWEERNAQKEREEEEKKARKRKGKKGKGGRPSEAKVVPVAEPSPKPQLPPPSPVAPAPVVSIPVPPAPQAPQALETKPEVAGQKRKLQPEMSIDTSPAIDTVSLSQNFLVSHSTKPFQTTANKVRKVSTPKTPKEPKAPQRRQSAAAPPIRRDSKEVALQTELVERIEDLQSKIRVRAAQALVKLFVESTQQAIQQGAFKLPTGQSVNGFGNRLGLGVEYALYLNFWGHTGDPSPLYGSKMRMIIHNVKANLNLRDRLLTGSLSPNDLSKMNSDDMASKELREETAQIIKESEKQHMLVQEEGPRIRRTHKGEEIVGDDSQHLATAEPVYTPVPRRKESVTDAGNRQASPEQMSPNSPNVVELPHDISRSPASARPLTVDTKVRPRPSEPRKSSSNFNIDTVWSSVDSPGIDRQRQYPPVSSGAAPDQSHNTGVKADPEIDSLLKDEEDEEPYSPMDYEMEPGTIWRGDVTMATVAEFRGSARYVAGANLSSVYPWQEMMPTSLSIEGRIEVDKASTYLCGLQWSKTTDVTVVAISPTEHATDQSQFEKLFDYFKSRNRYGVINKCPNPQVRDTYVVPLESGDAKKPEFIELLQECFIEDNRPSRMLLITYVIKTKPNDGGNGISSAQATPRQPDFATASPIAPPIGGGHIRTSSMTQHMSPSLPQGGFGSPVPPQQAPSQPQPAPGSTMVGTEAARLVLGEMAAAPTVAQLLSSVPDTTEDTFRIIKEVFEQQPATRTDWGALMGALTARAA